MKLPLPFRVILIQSPTVAVDTRELLAECDLSVATVVAPDAGQRSSVPEADAVVAAIEADAGTTIEWANVLEGYAGLPLVLLCDAPGKVESLLETLAERPAVQLLPRRPAPELLSASLRLVVHQNRREAKRRAATPCDAFQLDCLLEYAFDATLRVDKEGRITYASANAAAILGTADADLAGKRLNEIGWTGASVEALRDLLATSAKAATSTYVERTFQTARGSRTLQVKLIPEATAGEAQNGQIVIAHDVSKLVRSTRELEQNQQLAGIGILAGGVAHEFNNVNTIILGNLDLMMAQKGRSDKDGKRLKAMREAVDRATKVTRDLLNYSRRGPLTKTRTNLDRLVSEVIEDEYPKLRQGQIEVKFEPGKLPSAVLDESEIRQVLANLVSNARHAMLGQAVRQLHIATAMLDGELIVRLSDTGVGIRPDDRPKLFLPFYSTKGVHAADDSPQSKQVGTGLGLSVSDAIVREHGGRIDVESTLEMGSTFTVRLPYVAPEPTGDEVPHGATLHDWRGARVLAVDDEEMIRGLYREILGEAGFEVELAADAAEALEMVHKNRYHAIIVDLQMPGMSGTSLIRAMRLEPLPYDPIILVATGKLTDRTIGGYGDLGVHSTLYKPFDRVSLIHRLRDALTDRLSGPLDETFSDTGIPTARG